MRTKILFLFLFLIPFVYSEEVNCIASVECEILTVGNCIGNIDVYVESELDIESGEFFLNCNRINDTRWTCLCNNPFTLYLNTRLDTINEYDFILDFDVEVISNDDSSGSSNSGGDTIYYIRRLNATGGEEFFDEDGNKIDKDDIPSDATIVNDDDQSRKVEVNNVNVGPAEPEPAKLPEITGSGWVWFLVFFIVFFGLLVVGGIYVFKKMLKDPDDEIEINNEVVENVTDDDVDKYLEKLNK